jgi:WD40 repeat protein
MDHSIQLWDAATGIKLRRFEGHTDDVHGLEFSPDGTRIVSGSADKTVKLWDLNSGREIRNFAGHVGPIEKVSFDADGTKILSQGFDGSRIVWDTTTGLQVQPMDAVVWNSSLVGSGDERWRILPYKNSIRVIDLQFKHNLRERQCRQRRASPDSLWHLENAESSEATNQWYAATYHRAWVVESLKREEQSHDLRFIDAPEKLLEAYSKWRESLENSTDDKLADPDILLQPSVRNVLQSIKEEK